MNRSNNSSSRISIGNSPGCSRDWRARRTRPSWKSPRSSRAGIAARETSACICHPSPARLGAASPCPRSTLGRSGCAKPRSWARRASSRRSCSTRRAASTCIATGITRRASPRPFASARPLAMVSLLTRASPLHCCAAFSPRSFMAKRTGRRSPPSPRSAGGSASSRADPAPARRARS